MGFGLLVLALGAGWWLRDAARPAPVGPAVRALPTPSAGETPHPPAPGPEATRAAAGPADPDLAPAEEQALAARYAVTGRVVDEGSAPVAGAEVLLQDSERALGTGSLLPRVVATSAADGTFHVDGAPTELVRLAARTPRALGDWSAPLRLQPGIPRADVVLVVHAGVCLTGTVSDRANGEALEAELSFFDSATSLPHATRSRSDGAFELCGLRPGRAYVIVVQAEGYAALSGRNVVEVPAEAAGSLAPLDLLLDLRPHGVLRVVDALSGLPIPGARLDWAAALSARLPRTENPFALRGQGSIGQTDGQGLCDAPPLRPGSAGILVSAAGYAPRIVRGGDWLGAVEGLVELRLSPGHTLEVWVEGLEAGASAPVDLHLARRDHPDEPVLGDDPVRDAIARPGEPARFEALPPDRYVAVARGAGHARTWSPILPLLEPGGRTAITLSPAPGARLLGSVAPLPTGRRTLVRASGPAGLEERAPVSAAGAYQFPPLPAGTYRVWAEEEPLREIARTSRPVTPPHALEVVLAEGQERRLDLEFEGSSSTLAGSVRIDGALAPGRLVVASAVYAGDSAGGPWSDRRETLSDSDGRFVLTDLRGHQVRLSLAHPGPAGERLTLFERTFPRQDLDATIELEVGTAGLALRPILERDRSPLRWAQVELSADPDRGGVAGFAGTRTWRFQYRGSGPVEPVRLPPGAYVLDVQGADGLRAEARAILLVAGQTLELEVPLAVP